MSNSLPYKLVEHIHSGHIQVSDIPENNIANLEIGANTQAFQIINSDETAQFIYDTRNVLYYPDAQIKSKSNILKNTNPKYFNMEHPLFFLGECVLETRRGAFHDFDDEKHVIVSKNKDGKWEPVPIVTNHLKNN